VVTSHPVSGWLHILRISNNFISYAPKSLHYTHAGQAGVWILYNTNVRMAHFPRDLRKIVKVVCSAECSSVPCSWSRARSSLRTEIRSTPLGALGANGARACWAGRTACPTTWDFAFFYCSLVRSGIVWNALAARLTSRSNEDME
jgi:hypothetical protein